MKIKASPFKAVYGYIVGRTVEERKNFAGFGFILPWIIGVIWFFIVPMFKAMKYVFHTVAIGARSVEMTYVGLENIQEMFVKDPQPTILITSSLFQTLAETVIIVFLSIFIAIILNQSFRGRTFSRAVFALTIIVASGVVISIFKEDLFTQSMAAGSETAIFQTEALSQVLTELGLSARLVSTASDTISQMLDLIWKSGMQILLFQAGLLSIPQSLYEVCDVEGATPWQTFWKVTFPLITPYIFLNIIYTIIDSFTYYGNPVMKEINKLFIGLNYSYSTTVAMGYFLFVIIVTGVLSALISRRIYYIEK